MRVTRLTGGFGRQGVRQFDAESWRGAGCRLALTHRHPPAGRCCRDERDQRGDRRPRAAWRRQGRARVFQGFIDLEAGVSDVAQSPRCITFQASSQQPMDGSRCAVGKPVPPRLAFQDCREHFGGRVALESLEARDLTRRPRSRRPSMSASVSGGCPRACSGLM